MMLLFLNEVVWKDRVILSSLRPRDLRFGEMSLDSLENGLERENLEVGGLEEAGCRNNEVRSGRIAGDGGRA